MSERTCILPDEVRMRAQRCFESHYGEWAEALFLREAEVAAEHEAPSADGSGLGGRSFGLGIPTEKQALADTTKARDWVARWREDPCGDLVEWVGRDWSAMGRQTLPERVKCASWLDVARLAGRQDEGELLRRRTGDLAQRCRDEWRGTDEAGIAAAIRSRARSFLTMDEGDWARFLGVLDWIAAGHPLTPYVRQLPIRGIDTKWMERHRSLVVDFARCMGDPDFALPQAPPQIRIRMLDERLHVEGLSDLTLPADQAARLPILPERAIVCENLVSLMTLPVLSGTAGIFGAGYAAVNLSALPWLEKAPVLYWGDLDTNGFAILDRLRSALPHARSVLMDQRTLDLHLDLAVEESTPNLGTFSRLTEEEASVLARLKEGDPARGIATLRLEQERIEWRWACEQVRAAIHDGPSH